RRHACAGDQSRPGCKRPDSGLRRGVAGCACAAGGRRGKPRTIAVFRRKGAGDNARGLKASVDSTRSPTPGRDVNSLRIIAGSTHLGNRIPGRDANVLGRKFLVSNANVRVGKSITVVDPADEHKAPSTFIDAWKRFFLGKPLITENLEHESLSNVVALGALSPDAISSTVYGPEQIMVELLPAAGLAAYVLVLPITGVILLILALVTGSYRQVVMAYTQ